MKKLSAMLTTLKFYALSNIALIERTVEFLSQIKTLLELYGYIVIKAIQTIQTILSNK